MARHVVLLGGAILLGSLTLGGMCDPEPPLDSDCKPIECGEGRKFVCVDRCVRPREVGEMCSLDAGCAEDGTCVTGASCIPPWFQEPPLPEGKGVCVNIGQGLFGRCEPGLGDRCSNELFCRPQECASGQLGNRCVNPSRNGERCDSVYLPDGGQFCRICEPGTTCVGGGEDNNGYCLKSCTDDRECLCGDTCRDGYCRICRAFRQSCDVWHPCCDGTECGGTGTCCKTTGAEGCKTKADCCGTDRCVASGGGAMVCAPCSQVGEFCKENNDCCGGMPCRDGVCSPACAQGAPCDVADQQGPCATGEWDCFPGGKECRQTVVPADEKCNGKDDDCNGKTDDIEPTPCDETPKGCQVGFKATGTMACVGGAADCVISAGTDYCGDCGQFASIFCGACSSYPGGGTGEICGPQNLCPPNMICNENAGYPAFCGYDDQFCAQQRPACWHPGQVGTCCKDCTP